MHQWVNCFNRTQYHNLRSRHQGNKQQGAQQVTLTNLFLAPATQYNLPISQRLALISTYHNVRHRKLTHIQVNDLPLGGQCSHRNQLTSRDCIKLRL